MCRDLLEEHIVIRLHGRTDDQRHPANDMGAVHQDVTTDVAVEPQFVTPVMEATTRPRNVRRQGPSQIREVDDEPFISQMTQLEHAVEIASSLSLPSRTKSMANRRRHSYCHFGEYNVMTQVYD